MTETSYKRLGGPQEVGFNMKPSLTFPLDQYGVPNATMLIGLWESDVVVRFAAL